MRLRYDPNKEPNKGTRSRFPMQVCSSLEPHLPTVRHPRSSPQPLPGVVVAVLLDSVRTASCASSFVSLCDTIWGLAVSDSHYCIVLLLRICSSSSIFSSCQRIRLHLRIVPETSLRRGRKRRRNHQSWICMTFGQLLVTMR